jgi:DNA helicase-2/ATP-dependent DNA helicase PcrA
MIPKIKDKPTMVIAGPGAGKTHEMVSRIVGTIKYLRPNRILAAITFTNAATDSIREKVQDLIQIPPNVFIGTNYSFFNQFILLPFGTLFEYIPSDKLFLEIDVRRIVEEKLQRKGHPAALQAIRKRVLNSLLKEGKIPFEQIVEISSDLMKNPQIQKIVCNRIQFLFKDEFQDTDTTQMRIFDAIRKGKKTIIYSVGDPEQYILGFTYNNRRVKKPSFRNIPINKFASGCDKRENCVNKRACEELVQFTNNFHTSIKQKSEVGAIEQGGVFFIADTDLHGIIPKFIELTQTIIDSRKNSRRLFLGYENKTFSGFVEKYGLVPISNEHRRPSSTLRESLELLASAVQLSSKGIKDKHDLDAVGYRKLGIKLLKAVIAGRTLTIEQLRRFLTDDLCLQCQYDVVNLETKLEGLKSLLNRENIMSANNFYSSIHKAKGLEAECVLIVSKSKKELAKWLETDVEERCKDKADTCRIGYVGFTRAKYILCIACKQPIDGSIENTLLNLKVKILN